MTSSRPYLVRAIYEWLVDNGMTPYVLVDAEIEGVVVPRQFVENGKIILNVAPAAVQGLQLGNDRIDFSARFGGQAMDVYVPLSAVKAIYARENGTGMVFNDEMDGPNPPATPKDDGAKPKLKLVK
ncbi:MAG: ClpXP protease specificity-enhancing factor [Pseudomonadota bacterium]